MAKTVKDLIKKMDGNEKFSKEVFADPAKFQKEYNLSPAAVDALKKSTYEDALRLKDEALVKGGCYYGG